MSRYTKGTVVGMTDVDCVVEALQAMMPDAEIKVHETAQNLEGYRGDKRKEKANVIVPRRFVGGAANDLGFNVTSNGTVKYISENESYKYGSSWVHQMEKQYAKSKVLKSMNADGLFMTGFTEEDGKLKMVFETPDTLKGW